VVDAFRLHVAEPEIAEMIVIGGGDRQPDASHDVPGNKGVAARDI
jgi:hypothetical protein